MDTPELAAAIGARVRQQRQGLGWTLDQLADAAGVSRRMLINVEQGAANPSVGTLLRLSDALGIGLSTLVEVPHSEPLQVVRDGAAPALWTGPAGGRGLLVAATESPDIVELWDWSLAAGEAHSSEAHSTGTKELLQVRTGCVVVRVGEHEVTLRKGDAVTFAADLPHSYSNPGSRPARFSLAVFEPRMRKENPHA